MERFSPIVRPDVDSIAIGYPEMQPDPDGEYCRAELVANLTALLRTVLDHAPAATWCDHRSRQRYETATAQAYALLEELGQ